VYRNEESKHYKKQPPDRRHDMHLRRVYGLTLVEYNRIVEEQGGVCAICHKPQPVFVRIPDGKRGGTTRRLPVDHDHTTGKVRGVICIYCNRAIGLLGDDPATFEAVAVYLRAHQDTGADEPASQRVQGA
jgi:hypothetical protein